MSKLEIGCSEAKRINKKPVAVVHYFNLFVVARLNEELNKLRDAPQVENFILDKPSSQKKE